MFIKIFNYNYSDNNPTETVIECDGYNIVYPEQYRMDLTMHRDGLVCSEWVLDRRDYAVYVMNDNGKTVESYWRLPRENGNESRKVA